MYLLIKEGCLHCEDVKDLKFSGLEILHVDSDYTVTVNGIKTMVDEEIKERGFPALIADNRVYIGANLILKFIKSLESGE